MSSTSDYSSDTIRSMASAEVTRSSRVDARRARERQIVDATRALFDERGMQEAEIGRIARAVGINKALIYRHFSSKEELFVLTVTRYLSELAAELAPLEEERDPATALRGAAELFAGFCLRYPAFLDCALSLMRQPAGELARRVSESVWFRLGQGMASCLGVVTRILTAGSEQGVFDVADPDFTANRFYTSVLGIMHLARIGVGVREAAPGVPTAFEISPERVRQACVDDAMALVRASR